MDRARAAGALPDRGNNSVVQQLQGLEDARRDGTIELPDGLRIEPVPSETLHEANMETYADHRMATFAAMLGLRIPDIQVINVATTRKTLPDFVGMWNGMLA